MNLLDKVSPDVRRILDRALSDEEIPWPEALRLCETDGIDFQAMVLTADELRTAVGDETGDRSVGSDYFNFCHESPFRALPPYGFG